MIQAQHRTVPGVSGIKQASHISVDIQYDARDHIPLSRSDGGKILEERASRGELECVVAIENRAEAQVLRDAVARLFELGNRKAASIRDSIELPRSHTCLESLRDACIPTELVRVLTDLKGSNVCRNGKSELVDHDTDLTATYAISVLNLDRYNGHSVHTSRGSLF